jgi:hypothetical protein
VPDAGVVDQDVEPAAAGERRARAEQVADGRLVGHVQRPRGGGAAGGVDLAGDARRGIEVQVGDDHVRPLTREQQRDVAPDARARPRDHRRLPVQAEHRAALSQFEAASKCF